jgi:hypothetical protein
MRYRPGFWSQSSSGTTAVPVCGATTISTRLVQRHQIVHTGSGATPWQGCVLCGMSFAMAELRVEEHAKIGKIQIISTLCTIIESVTMQLTMTSGITAEDEKGSKVWYAT